ncbi:MAG: 2,3-bisphosphoglycerate-independent phosphoglycerate mutase [Pseudomonadota bacterium]
MQTKTPLLLLILDGWGVREAAPDNAISAANTPNWDRLWQHYPHSLLDTSGTAVGLPEGQMGNSEVGHMNIGAGRIVYQELTRIGIAIDEGEFEHNTALSQAINTPGRSNSVHILGLLSDGGVHSHIDHLLATLELTAQQHNGPVVVHALLDGRDTPPRSADGYIETLEAAVDRFENASIGSIGGRYIGMDRYNRWERVERAWQAIVLAESAFDADSASAALAMARSRDESDEFIQPTTINGGHPIVDGDSVIFVNFRADRARQLSRALVEPGFTGFAVQQPRLAAFTTMTQYIEDLPAEVAFPPNRLERLFGEEISRAGLKQLRIAETEKYAHVTYFFNGGEEHVFDGEDRKLIPSPDVATYDLKPAMSSVELTDALVSTIASGEYPVIICNVANPDMVGHTGVLDAAIQAVESVDMLLGRLVAALDEVGGEMLVTADHGNIEQMRDPDTGQPHTAHTTHPVPLVFYGRPADMIEQGSLRDIAPTMLKLLALDIPDEMTGQPLLQIQSPS